MDSASSTSQIKAIFFDLDGTLLDTFEFIYQAFAHAISSQELPQLEREAISALMGRPLEECYQVLAPGKDYDHLSKLHRDFQSDNIHLAELFPSTIHVLDTLRAHGVRVVAITSRSKRTSVRTLQSTGILPHFDLVISAEDASHTKPHPAPLIMAMEQLQLDASEVLMVGDTESDVLAGRNAGVRTVGVTFGFGGDLIHDSKPDYVIEDLTELLPIALGSNATPLRDV